MTNDRKSRPVPLSEGYQPKPEEVEKRGYQPQGSGLKPEQIKPPRGDTAIQPPKAPAGGKGAK